MATRVAISFSLLIALSRVASAALVDDFPRLGLMQRDLGHTPGLILAPISSTKPHHPSRLFARQNACAPGPMCADGNCCDAGEYCTMGTNGLWGCCPTGQICSGDGGSNGGNSGCKTSGYSLCPSKEFCCPTGDTCYGSKSAGTELCGVSCRTGETICPSGDFCCGSGLSCYRDAISNDPICKNSFTTIYPSGTPTNRFTSTSTDDSTTYSATFTTIPTTTRDPFTFTYSSPTATETESVFGGSSSSSGKKSKGKSSGGKKGKVSVAGIAGGIAAAVVLAIISLALWWWKRRKASKHGPPKMDQGPGLLHTHQETAYAPGYQPVAQAGGPAMPVPAPPAPQPWQNQPQHYQPPPSYGYGGAPAAGGHGEAADYYAGKSAPVQHFTPASTPGPITSPHQGYSAYQPPSTHQQHY